MTSSADARDSPLSSRRHGTRAKTNAGICRTCSNCRSRKVKCDGQRPLCGTCRTRNLACDYPKDARKTAVRTRREDVKSLHKQIEDLRRQVGDSPSNAASQTATGQDESHALERCKNTGIETVQPEELTASAQYGTTYLIFDDRSCTPSRTPFAHRTPGSTATVTEDILYAQTPAPTNETTARDTQVDEDNTQEAEGVQVYGATSLLHDHTSRSSLVNARQRLAGNNPLVCKEAIKDRLISNAAIRRQEELMLHSSPSITANIDFDGVPADTAMHLLDLHWNRQHLSYLLTYRPAVMDSLVRNGPYSNKLLLNAIYLQSSLYSDRTCLRLNSADPQSRGMAYYNRFKVLLADYVDKPTIPTVVALLTCGACLVPRGMQSAGWIFCGIGYRMLADIGCHLDVQTVAIDSSNYRSSAIDLELRKRVYWGAYVGDMLQSLFLGRSPTMPEVHGTVSKEYFDSYEELEEWKPYTDPLIEPLGMRVSAYQARPSYALSTFQSLLRLCDIMGRVIREFYSTTSAETAEETLLEERDKVREQLLRWKADLPEWLRFEPGVDVTPPPHQITPHAIFWTLTILTEQAFLNRGHFTFTLDTESKREAEERCLNAALRIWKLVEVYKQTFTLRRAQYGISYASYCAVVVILQQASHDSEEHIKCIRFFWLALLEYQRGCNYGLKRPLKLLKSLMRRLEGIAQDNEPEDTGGNNQQLPDLQADFNSLFGSFHGAEGVASWHGVTDLWDPSASTNLLFEDANLGVIDDSVFGFYM